MKQDNPILNNPYEEPRWHYATTRPTIGAQAAVASSQSAWAKIEQAVTATTQAAHPLLPADFPKKLAIECAQLKAAWSKAF
jgi:hypothetical protein